MPLTLGLLVLLFWNGFLAANNRTTIEYHEGVRANVQVCSASEVSFVVAAHHHPFNNCRLAAGRGCFVEHGRPLCRMLCPDLPCHCEAVEGHATQGCIRLCWEAAQLASALQPPALLAARCAGLAQMLASVVALSEPIVAACKGKSRSWQMECVCTGAARGEAAAAPLPLGPVQQPALHLRAPTSEVC